MSKEETKISYNKLYEQLVCHAEDDFDKMAGMLAYGEYKWKKNRFFARYCKEHGKNPDQEAIDNFMLEYKDEEVRNDLLESARNDLYSFAEEYIEARKDEMIKDLKETEVIRTVKKSTAWWKGFLFSILAAFTYSIILAGVTFTITVLNPTSPLAKFIKSILQ